MKKRPFLKSLCASILSVFGCGSPKSPASPTLSEVDYDEFDEMVMHPLFSWAYRQKEDGSWECKDFDTWVPATKTASKLRFKTCSERNARREAWQAKFHEACKPEHVIKKEGLLFENPAVPKLVHELGEVTPSDHLMRLKSGSEESHLKIWGPDGVATKHFSSRSIVSTPNLKED